MTVRDIKMIGLDLDGTLLTSDKTLTENTKRVLKAAIDQGVVVLPATGRSISGLPKELLEFPGIRYALTANGARVIDMQENKVIYENLVPYETSEKLLDIMGKYDTILEVYYDGVGFSGEAMLKRVNEFLDNPAMANYVATTRRAVPDVRKMFTEKKRSSDKVQALFLNDDDKWKAWAEIEAAIPDVEITGALAHNIEVNAAGVSKGKTLVNLGKLLGISRDEIMACGDGTNDTDMIKEAGLGVAMENAVPCVKEAADVITASNDDEGVAKAIEKYVLKHLEG